MHEKWRSGGIMLKMPLELWFQIPTPLLFSSVVRDRLLTLSGPWFPHLQHGDNKALTSNGCGRNPRSCGMPNAVPGVQKRSRSRRYCDVRAISEAPGPSGHLLLKEPRAAAGSRWRLGTGYVRRDPSAMQLPQIERDSEASQGQE